MATVSIKLVRCSNRAQVGLRDSISAFMPVPESVPQGAEEVTSSGTSQATTLASSDNYNYEFWDIVVSGGNVRLAFAASPTAAADSGWLILDGERVQFGASGSGERVAVIDAS